MPITLTQITMAWPFRCISPDFIVRSVDDTAFGVKRRCLTDGSELFSM
jgi:hypothetical protein